MNRTELSAINVADLSLASVNNLDYGRQKIERIIRKYVAKSGEHSPLWDLPDEISKDIGEISVWIMYMAPRIGYLEGLVSVAEEQKKLARAKASLAAQGIDEHTKKAKTAAICEHEGRVAIEAEIETFAKITAASASFKAFHFQVNRFIETLTNRLKTLRIERINNGETNEQADIYIRHQK